MNERTGATTEPYIIKFPVIGKPEEGYISMSEYNGSVPFEIKRVFWTYYTPHHVTRGRHAHYELYQVLIAVSGIITVTTENRARVKNEFVLDKPGIGLLLPPDCWHEMNFSHNGVLMAFASTIYNESDYIRSYDKFLKI